MSSSPNGMSQFDEIAGTSSTAGKRKRHQSTDRFPWISQDQKYSRGTIGYIQFLYALNCRYSSSSIALPLYDKLTRYILIPLYHRLGEEIEDYFEWITVTPKEHECRVGVFNRIETAVKKRWPSAKVEIFGSFPTGMFLPDG